MENDEYTAYVVQRLSHGGEPNDIIYDLCQKANLSWPEAEKLVKRVQAEDGKEITQKQFPLLFALAFGIFVGGLGLIGFGTYIILTEVSLFQAAMQSIPRVTENFDAFQRVYVTGRVLFEAGSTPLYCIFLGAGMVLGSLLGMRDAWVDIFNR